MEEFNQNEIQTIIGELKSNVELFNAKISTIGKLDEKIFGDSGLTAQIKSISQDIGSVYSRIEQVEKTLNQHSVHLEKVQQLTSLFGESQKNLQNEMFSQMTPLKTNSKILSENINQAQRRLEALSREADHLKSRNKLLTAAFFILIPLLLATLFFEVAGLRRTSHLKQSIAEIQNATSSTTVPKEASLGYTPPLPSAEYSPPDRVTSIQLMASSKAQGIIENRARYTLTYIKGKNVKMLSEKYIHPTQGIHFYPFGLSGQGRQFKAKSAATLISDPTSFDWGPTEINSSTYRANFNEYYRQYVYDQDYLSAGSIQYNNITLAGSSGLSGTAIAEKYPGAIFVEYVKGEKSLVLVFRQVKKGYWYLEALIHNQ